MRIGEVHALLRQEMPDIELSKIRYYEDKGLVQPARSRKGYRLYSERDVACLREAIRLAHEEFVPLRVVRLRLIEQGLLNDLATTPSPRHAARASAASVVSMPAPSTSPLPTVSVVPDAALDAIIDGPDVLDNGDQSDQYFTTSEFLKLSQLDVASINQLIGTGLLVPRTKANETVFSGLDVRVAQCCAPLIERGVDLRLLGSLRRVVEREIGILEDLTMALRSPASRASAHEVLATVQDVAGEVAALRVQLFERALRDCLGR